MVDKPTDARDLAIRFGYLAAALADDIGTNRMQLSTRKAGAQRKLVYHIGGAAAVLSLEAGPEFVAALDAELAQMAETKLLTGENPPDTSLEQAGTREPDPG
jgi:hypothetical protein